MSEIDLQVRVDGDLLHILFPSGAEECWTALPSTVPIDGTLEVLIFDGRAYLAPPRDGDTRC